MTADEQLKSSVARLVRHYQTPVAENPLDQSGDLTSSSGSQSQARSQTGWPMGQQTSGLPFESRKSFVPDPKFSHMGIGKRTELSRLNQVNLIDNLNLRQILEKSLLKKYHGSKLLKFMLEYEHDKDILSGSI